MRSRKPGTILEQLTNPAWETPVPLLVRRTGVDLEFVVADAALDIGAELIATKFAARMPVENAHFPP